MHRRTLLRVAALGLLPRPTLGEAGVLVAQGDSLTHGSSPAYPVVSYARLLAARYGLALVDQAFNGSVIATQAPAWLDSPPGLTVSLCGYNDMRIGTPLDLYELALTGAAWLARQRGPVMLGGCLRMTAAGYAGYGSYTRGSDAAVAACNVVIARVASRVGAAWVPVDDYDPATMGSGDDVHPSAAGQALIADLFAARWGRSWLPALSVR